MKYHLSARQAKELANGKTLRIAMPHPAEAIVDLAGWVGEHLAIPPGCVQYGAEALRLPVDPTVRPAGLAAVFGTLLHAQMPVSIVIEVECIVVELAKRRRQRGRYPMQWPGSVVLDDGRRIPPVDE